MILTGYMLVLIVTKIESHSIMLFPIHFILLVFVFIGKPSIDKTLHIFEAVSTLSMEQGSACVLATLQKTPQTIQGPGHQDSDCYLDHKKWRHVECHPAH